MAQRPNIVLICVDQWRGDCLSIENHPVLHTPYLDQLALDGVRLNRAYSACPTCIAARAAIFTGLSQRSHGRVGYRDGVPWNYPVTLAGEFTKNGYQTQAVGKMHVYPERSQMGFQNVVLHDGFLHFARDQRRNRGMIDDYLPWLCEQLGREADYFDHGLNCNAVPTRPWDKDECLHPTNWVVHQSIDFLRRRDPRKPFFLFMSFHRPHPPYDPPAWAFDMYKGREMPPRPVGDWESIFEPFSDPKRPDCGVGPIDPHVLQLALAGYYGQMTHIDHQVNRFIEVLHEYRERDNTWICFVSDHGEMLGDHNLFRKSVPYEGSARVPMILKGPRDSGLKQGQSFNPVVELRDIMPTLMDCAGLGVPESVEGRSFLPIARGQKTAWREYLHGEHLALGQSIHWVTGAGEKYVWFSGSGKEQLFDLNRDPQELHDISAAEPQRVAHWRQRLISELTGREEAFTNGKQLIPGRPVKAVLEKILAETATA